MPCPETDSMYHIAEKDANEEKKNGITSRPLGLNGFNLTLL